MHFLNFHLVLTILLHLSQLIRSTCYSFYFGVPNTFYSILLNILFLMKTFPRIGSKCCPWPLPRTLYLLLGELIHSLRFKYNLLLKFPSLHSSSDLPLVCFSALASCFQNIPFKDAAISLIFNMLYKYTSFQSCWWASQLPHFYHSVSVTIF